MENTVRTWNEAGFFDVKRSNETGGRRKPNPQFTGTPCTPPGYPQRISCGSVRVSFVVDVVEVATANSEGLLGTQSGHQLYWRGGVNTIFPRYSNFDGVFDGNLGHYLPVRVHGGRIM